MNLSEIMTDFNISLADYRFLLYVNALQAPGNICVTIAGFIALTSNSLMLITILKSKMLHSKSMCVLGSLAAAEIVQSITLFIAFSLTNLALYSTQGLYHASTYVCLCRTLFIKISAMAVANFTLALSIDRFLALNFPNFYRNLNNKKYVSIVNAIAWAYGVLLGFLAFLGADTDATWLYCSGADPGWYVRFLFLENETKIVFTIAIYVYTAVVLFRRLRAIKRLSAVQMKEERRKLELGTFRTIIVVIVVYSMSVALPYILTMTIKTWSLKAQIRFGICFILLLAFSSLSHFFVYIAMSKVFRNSFRAFFCCYKLPVGSWWTHDM